MQIQLWTFYLTHRAGLIEFLNDVFYKLNRKEQWDELLAKCNDVDQLWLETNGYMYDSLMLVGGDLFFLGGNLSVKNTISLRVVDTNGSGVFFSNGVLDEYDDFPKFQIVTAKQIIEYLEQS
jgi:hypothetical protein